MSEIVVFIVSVIFYALITFCFVKKQNTLIKKVLVFIFFSILFVPAFFISLDNMDIFTKMGWFRNSNSERWFSFFSNYIPTIIGTALSGTVLLYVTLIQIGKTNMANVSRETEDRRINIMPFFKYVVNSYDSFVDKSTNYNVFEFLSSSSINQDNKCILACNIKNIGLNTARGIFIKFVFDSSIISASPIIRPFNPVLQVSDSIQFYIGFKNLSGAIKNSITLVFFYQDLLFNCYRQDIILDIVGFDLEGKLVYNFVVNNEIQISNEEYNLEKENEKC